jgi:hypothetical protein
MMTGSTEVQTLPPPSPASLAKTTLAAVGVAAVILVTLVLPAEYGIDPLGTGRRLGLTAIANPTLAPVEVPVPRVGDALVPVQSGPAALYPIGYKVDAVELTIDAYEFLEYKYHLEKGAHMLYSWTASAPVLHDFHGEPQGDGGGAEQSYDKAPRREGHGALTAPFSGIHGWFWENEGATPITIKLWSAGFYTSAIEIRADRSRHPHQIGPPGPITR